MKVDNKGRFLKIHNQIEVECPCGKKYTVSEGRIKIGRGKYCSKNCMYKYRVVVSGNLHHNWKGNDVGYSAIHDWVKGQLGKPSNCEYCGTKESKQFEWANISGEYKRNLSDWQRLCTKCHHKFDNIASKGWKTRKEQNV